MVELFLAESGDFAVPIELLCQFLNRRVEEIRELLRRMNATRIVEPRGRARLHDQTEVDGAAGRAASRRSETFTPRIRLRPGRDMEELRDKLPGRRPAQAVPRVRGAARAREGRGARRQSPASSGAHGHARRPTTSALPNRSRACSRLIRSLRPTSTQLEQAVGIGRAKTHRGPASAGTGAVDCTRWRRPLFSDRDAWTT